MEDLFMLPQGIQLDFCPCGSWEKYERCCEPLHQGEAPASALALMRSRYSAYALGLVDYLIKTTHPKHKDSKTPIAKKRQRIQQFSESTDFNGLDILAVEEGEPISMVTFRAHLSRDGIDCSFTEKSSFEKWQGRWCYVKGEISDSPSTEQVH